MSVVVRDARLLRYASEKIRSSKEFMLECFKINNYSLQYANYDLQKEIILDVIQNDIDVLNCASDEILKDKEFILQLLRINWNVMLIIADHYFEHELREAYRCGSTNYG